MMLNVYAQHFDVQYMSDDVYLVQRSKAANI